MTCLASLCHWQSARTSLWKLPVHSVTFTQGYLKSSTGAPRVMNELSCSFTSSVIVVSLPLTHMSISCQLSWCPWDCFTLIYHILLGCRDLKPQNVLLDRAWKVKLCDFGLAGFAKVDAGTPAYMAPELLAAEGMYTDKVDVYAFGVLFNEILSRRPPFAGVDGSRAVVLAQGGQRPEIPLSVPADVKALIQSCWHDNPSERPSFKDIHARLLTIPLQAA